MFLRISCKLQPINTSYQNTTLRLLSSQVQTNSIDITSKGFETDYKNALPYSKIPGPSAFTFLRSVLPGGKYCGKNIDEVSKEFRREYGDLYKFPSIFGSQGFVATNKPEDFQTIFRTEGHWPDRTELKTIVYYRTKIRPDIFGKYSGLANSQGKEWGDFRSAVNPAMMHPKNTKIYIPKVDEVATDFVNRIHQIRDPKTKEAPENFSNDLNRWALEAVSVIAMDTRLGLLHDKHDKRSAKLIQGAKDAFKLSFDLEFKPSLWKFFSTPQFKKLIEALDAVTDVSCEIIDEAQEQLKNKPRGSPSDEESVLEKLLQIDPLIAKVMAIDMLFGGMDTTSSTATSLLYFLAKNPEKQEILRKEIMTILPSKDSLLTVENMKNVPYLRACLKESLRMFPTVGVNVRRAGQNLVLQGYQIPKGTMITMGTNMLQNEDKYYPNADKFEPERWLKKDGLPAPAKSAHPFIFLPFGFGPRMCAGKRFAEMEIETLIARIIRNFQVEWHHPDLKFVFTSVYVPADKLLFTFKDI
ncbi:cytochrome P450 CYP12A2-like isoform X1 [Hermetia illucens]|uniref:cytochrome P450 CYP12A2-like isoform X1 n=1 Tax=Hermetia illucens TaxID=343691 RepID=UPI0018CC13D6|nr:cytochrome P450 CYP12A2-like isoform X1 [Hermetia illucens]